MTERYRCDVDGCRAVATHCCSGRTVEPYYGCERHINEHWAVCRYSLDPPTPTRVRKMYRRPRVPNARRVKP